MAEPAPASAPRSFPRVPAYAWSWFQRSRPVLTEAAVRLTGAPPGAGFVEELRTAFADDPFARDVVIGVVADVAFNGRVPARRPPGSRWDRGLTWWAAAIAGVTPEEFEARSQIPVEQRALFDAGERTPAPPRPAPAPARPVAAVGERAVLAAALRDLLRLAEDGRVPADAVRGLLEQLEGR